jgi:hypothetical protein
LPQRHSHHLSQSARVHYSMQIRDMLFSGSLRPTDSYHKCQLWHISYTTTLTEKNITKLH